MQWTSHGARTSPTAAVTRGNDVDVSDGPYGAPVFPAGARGDGFSTPDRLAAGGPLVRSTDGGRT